MRPNSPQPAALVKVRQAAPAPSTLRKRRLVNLLEPIAEPYTTQKSAF
jgi:anthranilate phosphoribosyltransferase